MAPLPLLEKWLKLYAQRVWVGSTLTLYKSPNSQIQQLNGTFQFCSFHLMGRGWNHKGSSARWERHVRQITTSNWEKAYPLLARVEKTARLDEEGNKIPGIRVLRDYNVILSFPLLQFQIGWRIKARERQMPGASLALDEHFYLVIGTAAQMQVTCTYRLLAVLLGEQPSRHLSAVQQALNENPGRVEWCMPSSFFQTSPSHGEGVRSRMSDQQC